MTCARRLAGLLLLVLLALPGRARAGTLTPELVQALDAATYVYVQSERKSGAWSAPAEIWFFRDGDAVVVGTKPTSWRVKRIRAGRSKARIAVGSATGPAFEATGTIVKDPALEQKLATAYAKKYPDRWPKYAEDFAKGFASGDRVLVRYVPR
jgi:hypothetical protein